MSVIVTEQRSGWYAHCALCGGWRGFAASLARLLARDSAAIDAPCTYCRTDG